MADHIRDRINRKLATLGEDRLYQVLDFVEFLELRYGQPATNPTPANPFQRFADGVEDRLRAGGIATSTVAEAMGFLNKAVGVLNNVATAGRTAATDFATAAQRMAESPSSAARAGTTPPAGTASAQGGNAAGPTAPPPATPGRPATDPTDMPSYPSPS